MHVVLINWNGGENDPFTVFNKTLSDYLHSCGKLTRILELTNPDWFKQLVELKSKGVDYVVSLQGIVTSQLPSPGGLAIWESLKTPLICLHGDHPCHHPGLHLMESQYCAHLYWMREFAHYSNRFFRRRAGAIYIGSPVFSSDTPLAEGRSGDHFVLLKNTTTPEEMEKKWRQGLSGPALSFTLTVAEAIKSHVVKNPTVDFHTAIDDLIAKHNSQAFDPQSSPGTYHALHSQIDMYVRNLKSGWLMDALSDVPVQVYGRGWEARAAQGNKLHQYFPGKNMVESQALYYSRYGILDVTPSTTGLHDRTSRALKNETPFLTSAVMPDFLPNMAKFGSLFYNFTPGDVRAKCEAIMKDPEAHAELSREFSHKYQEKETIESFVWKLELLARSMRQ